SLLNWTINNSLINWGKWSFTPVSGENLTPENGQVTVQVSIITPNEKNTRFDGYIRIENQNNPEDFDLIPVYLKTQVNFNTINFKFYPFILKFIYFFQKR
ncbi:MAG TPA: hypothetical protein VJ438_03065, partial [Candidatus Nanoarchaeia archaeon]|nr:hypothetical protein [Candidatus Nanoarchaeia archaeon]